MSEKHKEPKELWTTEPEEDDFTAARDYLTLLMGPEPVRLVINALRATETTRRRARDILRASRLPMLTKDDPDVASALKKIKQHKLLSPVLLLRGDWGQHVRPLEIADGYHRICASLIVDEDAAIACRFIDPWAT